MLHKLPLDIQHAIVWGHCVLLDDIRVDYDTVRAVRLTCHALYALLDCPPRWNRLACLHYPGVGLIYTKKTFNSSHISARNVLSALVHRLLAHSLHNAALRRWRETTDDHLESTTHNRQGDSTTF